MEDLIEYLQIKLAESFGEDDDNVIEKLRENINFIFVFIGTGHYFLNKSVNEYKTI